MKKICWFIKQSFILDYKLLRIDFWSWGNKIDFLFIKYFLIVKHFFLKFELGTSEVIFRNKKIYYDSSYGLADYQSMLTRQQNLLSYTSLNRVDSIKIFDVGANVGFYSLMCSDLFPKAKIHAFEPIPTTFKCLQSNSQLYKNIKVNNFGISSKDGNLKMLFNPKDSAVSQISSIGNVAVNLTTLDKYFANSGYKTLDLLKIDTEGHEAFVLKGGYTTLSKTKYLVMEVTLKDNPNYTLSSLMSLLYTKDFDYNLIAFRNYSDKGEGTIPIMDAVFINKKLTNT